MELLLHGFLVALLTHANSLSLARALDCSLALILTLQMYANTQVDILSISNNKALVNLPSLFQEKTWNY